MKENEILSELHRVREDYARECGYDVKEIFRRMRVHTEQLRAEGQPVGPPAPRETESSLTLRESPPERK